jgi:SHAQKYF class myb-like DNA-binding protein
MFKNSMDHHGDMGFSDSALPDDISELGGEMDFNEFSSSKNVNNASKSKRALNTDNGNDGNKRRFVWPDPLHRDFLAATFDIGLRHSTPKDIAALMSEHNGSFTAEQIDSHLQKLLMFRQRKKHTYVSFTDAARAQSQPGVMSNVGRGEGSTTSIASLHPVGRSSSKLANVAAVAGSAAIVETAVNESCAADTNTPGIAAVGLNNIWNCGVGSGGGGVDGALSEPSTLYGYSNPSYQTSTDARGDAYSGTNTAGIFPVSAASSSAVSAFESTYTDGTTALLSASQGKETTSDCLYTDIDSVHEAIAAQNEHVGALKELLRKQQLLYAVLAEKAHTLKRLTHASSASTRDTFSKLLNVATDHVPEVFMNKASILKMKNIRNASSNSDFKSSGHVVERGGSAFSAVADGLVRTGFPVSGSGSGSGLDPRAAASTLTAPTFAGAGGSSGTSSDGGSNGDKHVILSPPQFLSPNNSGYADCVEFGRVPYDAKRPAVKSKYLPAHLHEENRQHLLLQQLRNNGYLLHSGVVQPAVPSRFSLLPSVPSQGSSFIVPREAPTGRHDTGAQSTNFKPTWSSGNNASGPIISHSNGNIASFARDALFGTNDKDVESASNSINSKNKSVGDARNGMKFINIMRSQMDLHQKLLLTKQGQLLQHGGVDGYVLSPQDDQNSKHHGYVYTAEDNKLCFANKYNYSITKRPSSAKLVGSVTSSSGNMNENAGNNGSGGSGGAGKLGEEGVIRTETESAGNEEKGACLPVADDICERTSDGESGRKSTTSTLSATGGGGGGTVGKKVRLPPTTMIGMLYMAPPLYGDTDADGADTEPEMELDIEESRPKSAGGISSDFYNYPNKSSTQQFQQPQEQQHHHLHLQQYSSNAPHHNNNNNNNNNNNLLHQQNQQRHPMHQQQQQHQQQQPGNSTWDWEIPSSGATAAELDFDTELFSFLF